jgi:hypothetical protein
MFRQRTAHGLRYQPLYIRRLALSPAALRYSPPAAVFVANFTSTSHFEAAVKRARSKKTTIKLSDLPQGRDLVEPLPVEEEQNEPVLPPLVAQARRNMDKFEKCILLTRVGGFYELYFEHAEEYAPLLNLKLTSKKTNAKLVPMVVLPLFLSHYVIYAHTYKALPIYIIANRGILGRISRIPARPVSQNLGARSEPPCRRG